MDRHGVSAISELVLSERLSTGYITLGEQSLSSSTYTVTNRTLRSRHCRPLPDQLLRGVLFIQLNGPQSLLQHSA